MARKTFSKVEIESKMRRIRLELEQMKEMKHLLKLNGIDPDEDDKLRESRLIQRLLGFEKDLKRMAGKPVAPRRAKFSKARRHSR